MNARAGLRKHGSTSPGGTLRKDFLMGKDQPVHGNDPCPPGDGKHLVLAALMSALLDERIYISGN
jgi:hypothetical protein